MYRDAGNWKTRSCVLLVGIDDEAESVLRACLEWGEQFVPEQVMLPALYEQHWRSYGDGPGDLDHAFHEFVALRPADAGEIQTLKS